MAIPTAYEGHNPPLAGHPDVVRSILRRRQKRLGIILIIMGLLHPLLPTGWLVDLSLDIGLARGTIATVARFSARNLVLDIASGDVRLTPGAADEVVVEVKRHGFGPTERAGRDAARRLTMPVVVVDGDKVRVSEHSEPGATLAIFGRPAYRDYSIRVPRNGAVRISTGRGAIAAAGLAGDLAVKTRGGDITMERITGNVRVDSGSGTITIMASALRAPRLLTVNGDIRLVDTTVVEPVLETAAGMIAVDAAQGVTRVHTLSGNITIARGRQVLLDVKTRSGDITYVGSLSDSRSHRATTVSGNIILRLPESTRLDVRTETTSRDVRSDWALSGGAEDAIRQSKINGGGSALDIQSISGSIRLEREKPS